MHLYAFSPKGVFRCFLTSPAWRDGKSQMFALVRFFQLSPQIVCPKRDKSALIAFLHFFTWGSFQMFSQIACMNRCKVTNGCISPKGVFRCFLKSPAWIDGKSQMVALVRFFRLSPQIVCPNRCKVALVAFLHFFTWGGIQMFFFAWTDGKSHWLHLNDFSLEGVFKCFLKSPAWIDAKLQMVAFVRFFQLSP